MTTKFSIKLLCFITLICNSPSLCATLYYYEAYSYLRPIHIWYNNYSIQYQSLNPTLDVVITLKVHQLWKFVMKQTHMRSAKQKNMNLSLLTLPCSKFTLVYTCSVMNKVIHKEKTCPLQLKLTGRLPRRQNMHHYCNILTTDNMKLKQKNDKLHPTKICS